MTLSTGVMVEKTDGKDYGGFGSVGIRVPCGIGLGLDGIQLVSVRRAIRKGIERIDSET